MSSAEPGAAAKTSSGYGSYSDFPGGIVPAKAPKDTNKNTATSNNVGLPTIPNASSSNSAAHRNIAPINGPRESSTGSAGHGNTEPTSNPTASSSIDGRYNVPVPVSTGSYSAPDNNAHRGIPVFDVAAKELTQVCCICIFHLCQTYFGDVDMFSRVSLVDSRRKR